MIDLNFKYQDAISHFKKESPFTPDIAIILGSGLGDFADSTKKIKTLLTSEIPTYPAATVKGHQGLIHFSKVENKNIIIFQGRLHFYEGYNLSDCLLPSLITKKLGCNKIIFTNAAGGINSNFTPGDLMLIDSFNALNIKKELTGLIGIASLDAKNNFHNCPSEKLNIILKESAVELGIKLNSGTYWYTKGPSYETPAEIEMIRRFGGDAVGMSTVPEVIVARHGNMNVLGLSGISNKANLNGDSVTTHEEVLQAGRILSPKIEKLIEKFIKYNNN